MQSPSKTEFDSCVKHVWSVDSDSGNTKESFFRCEECKNFFEEKDLIFVNNQEVLMSKFGLELALCLKCNKKVLKKKEKAEVIET